MNIAGKPYRSIWPLENKKVALIDQRLLPWQFHEHTIDAPEQMIEAIITMRVRGAPLIGVAAAYGIALAMNISADDAALKRALEDFLQTRPTAVNLRWALDRMGRVLWACAPAARAAAAWLEAALMADEDVASNRALGLIGAELIRARRAPSKQRVDILTHCNAGWIATVDHGTALAAIYSAHDQGQAVHVWVSETRPRNQGLLTAWELAAHGVPHTLIVDNAAGHMLASGQVDMVLVGADRVSRQGDVCNKIGTYLKALAAHDCAVPFYAAVPTSTIDWTLEAADARSGKLTIEERSGDEVRNLRGVLPTGSIGELELCAPTTPTANPAFDITPARLVSGLITERGVCAPDQLARLFERE